MDSGAIFVGLLVGALLCGLVGAVIAASRGRAQAGFFSGFLLGPIGWIIAALLSPTSAIEAERDRRLAAEIAKAAGALGPRPSTATSHGNDVQSLRQEAVAEAVRRDPSLLSASTPEELKHLEEQTQQIEAELRLRQELEVVRARRLADDEQRRLTQVRAEEERKAAEERRAADEAAALQAAEEAESRRLANAQRAARAEAMAPLRRVVYLHKGATVSVAGLLAIAVAVLIALQVQSSSQRAEDVRLAAARSSASASASKASASSAAAAVAASRASVDAEVRNSQQASREAQAVAARRPICLKGAQGRTKDLSRCDFTKADLSNLDLSGRDLTGANLAGANLKGTLFDNAKLGVIDWTGARCPDGTLADDHGGNCEESFLELGDAARPARIGQPVEVADFTVTIRSFEASSRTNAIVMRQGEMEPRPGNVYALIEVRVRNNNTQAPYLNGELTAAINGESGYCAIDGGSDTSGLRPNEVVNSRLCLQVPKAAVRRGTIQINVGYEFVNNPPAYWSIS